MYKEKTLNKRLSIITVSERNIRRAFQKSSKHYFHFTRATVDVFLKKTEKLNSELRCRVYYCLLKKK